MSVFEGEGDKVHGFTKGHNKAGHRRLSNSDYLAFANLVYPNGNEAVKFARYDSVANIEYLGIEGVTASHIFLTSRVFLIPTALVD